MEMAAQYRPYRDEDSVDGLETTSWTDNEPGTLQIYEKTTEELPFSPANRKTFLIQLALWALFCFLGFLIGYYGPVHQHEIIKEQDKSAAFSAVKDLDHQEDTTIKEKLMAQIDANNILFVLKKYENTNRMPGSASNQEFAHYIAESFRKFGLHHISISNKTFKTMLPRQASIVHLLDKDDKKIYSSSEHDSYQYDDMKPFLPLSQASEQVISTNQVLYLNRGLKEDYSKLNMNLKDLEGKIFIIKQPYYQAHEAVITAQENGAKAVILFPDPEIYGRRSPFPNPLQVPDDTARSHPLAWSNYGDLASLNLSSLNSADISKIGLEKDTKVIIPVVLVSFKSAEKILRGLSGALAPKEWRDTFDFTLYVGPGYREEHNVDQRDKIRIEFYNQETQLTMQTVTGIITGSVEPDRYVIIGSRRDSLTRGLMDSVSGSATMLEIARVFGHLLKQGWTPRRTIIFNSFGAETLNLYGSSKWLEMHQRLLHTRAVAYVNCDQIVTGNRTATIAASPLLYQVLYNSTKQVTNPNLAQSNLHSVYDVWKDTHLVNKTDAESTTVLDQELNKILEEHRNLNSTVDEDFDGDLLGSIGEYLHEYKKSALVKSRPKVRHLDMQSIYSPFYLWAGIPVVDVRYAGFQNTGKQLPNYSEILEDTLPIISTKCDNFSAIQLIDPQLKYHVAVAQVLSEILRDLSDSVFLPFNLLDYAMTLRDNYKHFVDHYSKTIIESNLDLESLKQIIHEYTVAAAKFHQRQDETNPRDAIQVRKINDQLLLLERAFLDLAGSPAHWDRKHLILGSNDHPDNKGGFPGLVDWMTLLEGSTYDSDDYVIFLEILKVQYNALVDTISNAIKVINEVSDLT